MLEDKLKKMNAASAGKIPPETLAIMQRAKETLAASNILEKAIKAGDKFPDFTLADSAGNQLNFAELRKQGPVLICLYRGVW